MGGSTSKTRKLTVENDDPTSVIKVSEDVVDRIKGKQSVRQVSGQTSTTTQANYGQHGGQQPVYLYEPSLTTLQLRQTNVAELKKNDEYWQGRLRLLEKNHKKMNEIMDSEYNRALEEFKGKSESSVVQFQAPCQDTRCAVMECYKKYPNESMKCAKLVQAFQECVDLKRSSVVSNRG